MTSDPKKSHPSTDIEQELYQKRQKIYAREVHGLFATMRVLAMAGLMGIYYILPWIQWNGRQAVLLDLPARKFYFFGTTIWPQDFILVALLLMISAWSLFFFTNLAGRLWCGYACPQTVWTEVFMWFERKIEGDRPKQMKLDKMGWGPEKILRKGGKHLAWIAVAFWTGFTFVGWFSPITDLAVRMVDFQLGPWETFWVLFYGFATWGNAGFMREQVCIYMCPYARFQSAMFDTDTLIISYDEKRGEPRGTRRKDEDYKAAGKGDCIDCTICVQVCPVGIDIRDGLQYQCIACAACIDACDDVMEKMGYPKGLVRYTTENALEGKPSRVVRPRSIMYGVVLIAFIAGFLFVALNRMPLELNIIRDRVALFTEADNGDILNTYNLKIMNMAEETYTYRLSLASDDIAEFHSGGLEVKLTTGEVAEVPFQIAAAPDQIRKRSNEVTFILEAIENPEIRIEQSGRFLGPVFR
ncbi:MAG: cytochrome c oxidase accessory protein CcoG [Gammaproteobacteria bacterium]